MRPKAKAQDAGGVAAGFRCGQAAALGHIHANYSYARVVNTEEETRAGTASWEQTLPAEPASRGRAGASVGGELPVPYGHAPRPPRLRRAGQHGQPRVCVRAAVTKPGVSSIGDETLNGPSLKAN